MGALKPEESYHDLLSQARMVEECEKQLPTSAGTQENNGKLARGETKPRELPTSFHPRKEVPINGTKNPVTRLGLIPGGLRCHHCKACASK